MRTHSLLVMVTTATLLGTLACADPGGAPANKQANKQGAGKTAPAAKAGEVAPKPVEPTPAKPVEPVTPPADPDPNAAPAGIEAEPAPIDGDGASPAAEPAPAEPAPTPGAWTAPADADIRSDAVIPPGTPTANAEAFKKLAKAKTDGPPVSQIAGNGLHFDVMVVGRGWEKSRCVEPSQTFNRETDDRVSVCLRVVHPSDAEEVLAVEWVKDGGKATRRSTITVKPIHAYLTRGYLPMKSGYAGDWVAKITAPDGTVLAELPFTIE